jgi:hypothetical protein
MKKLLLLVIALGVIAANALAQKKVTLYGNQNQNQSSVQGQQVKQGEIKKDILYVDYFTKSPDLPVVYMQAARNQVIAGLINRGRVQVVDGESFYHGGFSQRSSEEMIKKSGARYVIWGTLDRYEYKRDGKPGKMSCMAKMHVSLFGQDLQSGRMFNPDDIQITGWGPTMDAADAEALSNICNRIDYFVEENCKFEAQVLQLCDPDDRGRVDLYIGAGSDMGVKNTDQFDIYKLIDIQGHSSQTKIGTVTVRGVEGASLSRCRTKKKQANAIVEAFNSGAKLIAVSAGESLF